MPAGVPSNPGAVQSYRAATALERVERRDEPGRTAAGITGQGEALLRMGEAAVNGYPGAHWTCTSTRTTGGALFRGEGAIRPPVHRTVVSVSGSLPVVANCMGTTHAGCEGRQFREGDGPALQTHTRVRPAEDDAC